MLLWAGFIGCQVSAAGKLFAYLKLYLLQHCLAGKKVMQHYLISGVCRNSLKKKGMCQTLDFSRCHAKGWAEIYSFEPGRGSYFHWLDSPCQLVTPRIKNRIVLFRELKLFIYLFKWCG